MIDIIADKKIQSFPFKPLNYRIKTLLSLSLLNYQICFITCFYCIILISLFRKSSLSLYCTFIN